MSARAGSSKGKSKKKKDAVKVEKDDLDDMDYEKLQEEHKKCCSSLLDVRRSRNYYQLEKDQVQGYYDILNEEIAKTNSHLKNIESQMERMQDTHRNDIRIYLQKVIHLEYEHSNNVESVNILHSNEKDEEFALFQQEKKNLMELKENLKTDLVKNEYAYEDEIKRIKEVERKEMQKLREQFERSHQELLNNYEQRLQTLKNDLILREKMEIHEIEERKNRHINDLMIAFTKNFEEMKNYYNSITQDNLDLIKELNNEIEDLKIAHLQNEKAMELIEKKNASLSEPLAIAENRVKILRYKLMNFKKDQISLKHAKNRLIVLEEQYKNMKENYSSLQQEYAKLENDRNRLYQTFEDTVLSVQRKASSKNAHLEQLLSQYSEVFEIKKQQFISVLHASNLDPVILSNVTKKLDDVLTAKNEQIEELKYETVKLIKTHNDMIRVYEQKLKKLNIPSEELQLEPLVQPQFGLPTTGTQPADLVVQ